MKDYIKIKNSDGSYKIVKSNYNLTDDKKEMTNNQWVISHFRYKNYYSQIRSQKYQGKIKIELYYNNQWLPLAIEDNPNISDLIIKFYKDKI